MLRHCRILSPILLRAQIFSILHDFVGTNQDGLAIRLQNSWIKSIRHRKHSFPLFILRVVRGSWLVSSQLLRLSGSAFLEAQEL